MQTLFSRDNYVRFAAWGTLLVFAVTSVAMPSSVFAAPLNPAQAITIQRLEIPERWGAIQTRFQGNQNSPLVLYIQDAHSITDAQRNAANLIRHFQKKYGINLMAIEGTQGKLDPSLLQAFPDDFLKRKVMKEYLEAGEIGGPELAAVLSAPGLVVEGLEDWALYEKNYSAYLRAIKNREPLLAKLAEIRKGLDARKEKEFSKGLKEFHNAWISFQDEKMDLVKFLQTVSLRGAVFATKQSSSPEIATPAKNRQARNDEQGYPALQSILESLRSDKPSSADLDTQLRHMAEVFRKKKFQSLSPQWQKEFNQHYQSFTTNQEDAGTFLKFFKKAGASIGLRLKLTQAMQQILGQHETLASLQGTKLFDELEAFARHREDELAKTDVEKNLIKEFRKYRILNQLAKLEWTREQMDEYAADPEAHLQLLGEIRKEIFSALQFYRDAMSRDQIFHDNLLAMMKRENQQTAMVLTGGFHARGFEKALREKGISYAVIMPKMESLEGSEHYEVVMKGEVSFEKYFQSTYYDAFMRHASEKLVGELSQPDFKRTLKLWRDNILRELSRQNRLGDAPKYTRFVDLLIKVYNDRFGNLDPSSVKKEEILKAVEEALSKLEESKIQTLQKTLDHQLQFFMKGMGLLKTENRLSGEEVRQLAIKTSQQVPAALRSGISPAAFNPAIRQEYWQLVTGRREIIGADSPELLSGPFTQQVSNPALVGGTINDLQEAIREAQKPVQQAAEEAKRFVEDFLTTRQGLLGLNNLDVPVSQQASPEARNAFWKLVTNSIKEQNPGLAPNQIDEAAYFALALQQLPESSSTPRSESRTSEPSAFKKHTRVVSKLLDEIKKKYPERKVKWKGFAQEHMLVQRNEALWHEILKVAERNKLLAHGFASYASAASTSERGTILLTHEWAMLNAMIEGRITKGDAGSLNFTLSPFTAASYGPYYAIFDRFASEQIEYFDIPKAKDFEVKFYLVPDQKEKEFFRDGLSIAVANGIITNEFAAKVAEKTITYQEFINNDSKIGDLIKGNLLVSDFVSHDSKESNPPVRSEARSAEPVDNNPVPPVTSAEPSTPRSETRTVGLSEIAQINWADLQRQKFDFKEAISFSISGSQYDAIIQRDFIDSGVKVFPDRDAAVKGMISIRDHQTGNPLAFVSGIELGEAENSLNLGWITVLNHQNLYEELKEYKRRYKPQDLLGAMAWYAMQGPSKPLTETNRKQATIQELKSQMSFLFNWLLSINYRSDSEIETFFNDATQNTRDGNVLKAIVFLLTASLPLGAQIRFIIFNKKTMDAIKAGTLPQKTAMVRGFRFLGFDFLDFEPANNILTLQKNRQVPINIRAEARLPAGQAGSAGPASNEPGRVPPVMPAANIPPELPGQSQSQQPQRSSQTTTLGQNFDQVLDQAIQQQTAATQPAQTSMDTWIEKEVAVAQAFGLHLRLAADLVEAAQIYQNAGTMINLKIENDELVLASSMLSLSIKGITAGQKLVLKAKGLHAEQAISQMARMLTAYSYIDVWAILDDLKRNPPPRSEARPRTVLDNAKLYLREIFRIHNDILRHARQARRLSVFERQSRFEEGRNKFEDAITGFLADSRSATSAFGTDKSFFRYARNPSQFPAATRSEARRTENEWEIPETVKNKISPEALDRLQQVLSRITPRYHILDFLASGTEAEVYKLEDIRTGKKVALRVAGGLLADAFAESESWVQKKNHKALLGHRFIVHNALNKLNGIERLKFVMPEPIDVFPMESWREAFHDSEGQSVLERIRHFFFVSRQLSVNFLKNIFGRGERYVDAAIVEFIEDRPLRDGLLSRDISQDQARQVFINFIEALSHVGFKYNDIQLSNFHYRKTNGDYYLIIMDFGLVSRIAKEERKGNVMETAVSMFDNALKQLFDSSNRAEVRSVQQEGVVQLRWDRLQWIEQNGRKSLGELIQHVLSNHMGQIETFFNLLTDSPDEANASKYFEAIEDAAKEAMKFLEDLQTNRIYFYPTDGPEKFKLATPNIPFYEMPSELDSLQEQEIRWLNGYVDDLQFLYDTFYPLFEKLPERIDLAVGAGKMVVTPGVVREEIDKIRRDIYEVTNFLANTNNPLKSLQGQVGLPEPSIFAPVRAELRTANMEDYTAKLNEFFKQHPDLSDFLVPGLAQLKISLTPKKNQVTAVIEQANPRFDALIQTASVFQKFLDENPDNMPSDIREIIAQIIESESFIRWMLYRHDDESEEILLSRPLRRAIQKKNIQENELNRWLHALEIQATIQTGYRSPGIIVSLQKPSFKLRLWKTSYERAFNEPVRQYREIVRGIRPPPQSQYEGTVQHLAIVTHEREKVIETVKSFADNLVAFDHKNVVIHIFDDSTDARRQQRKEAILELAPQYKGHNIQIQYFDSVKRQAKTQELINQILSTPEGSGLGSEFVTEAVELTLDSKGRAAANRNWAMLELGRDNMAFIDDDMRPEATVTEGLYQNKVIPVDFLSILNHGLSYSDIGTVSFLYSGFEDEQTQDNLNQHLKNPEIHPLLGPWKSMDRLFHEGIKNDTTVGGILGIKSRAVSQAIFQPPGVTLPNEDWRIDDFSMGLMQRVLKNTLDARNDKGETPFIFVPATRIDHHKEVSGRGEIKIGEMALNEILGTALVLNSLDSLFITLINDQLPPNQQFDGLSLMKLFGERLAAELSITNDLLARTQSNSLGGKNMKLAFERVYENLGILRKVYLGFKAKTDSPDAQKIAASIRLAFSKYEWEDYLEGKTNELSFEKVFSEVRRLLEIYAKTLQIWPLLIQASDAPVRAEQRSISKEKEVLSFDEARARQQMIFERGRPELAALFHHVLNSPLNSINTAIFSLKNVSLTDEKKSAKLHMITQRAKKAAAFLDEIAGTDSAAGIYYTGRPQVGLGNLVTRDTTPADIATEEWTETDWEKAHLTISEITVLNDQIQDLNILSNALKTQFEKLYEPIPLTIKGQPDLEKIEKRYKEVEQFVTGVIDELLHGKKPMREWIANHTTYRPAAIAAAPASAWPEGRRAEVRSQLQGVSTLILEDDIDKYPISEQMLREQGPLLIEIPAIKGRFRYPLKVFEVSLGNDRTLFVKTVGHKEAGNGVLPLSEDTALTISYPSQIASQDLRMLGKKAAKMQKTLGDGDWMTDTLGKSDRMWFRREAARSARDVAAMGQDLFSIVREDLGSKEGSGFIIQRLAAIEVTGPFKLSFVNGRSEARAMIETDFKTVTNRRERNVPNADRWVDITIPETILPGGGHLIAVLDGTAGADELSERLSQIAWGEFVPFIAKYKENLREGMVQFFKLLNAEAKNFLKNSDDPTLGSTASFALINGSQIIAANLGDSPIVIFNQDGSIFFQGPRHFLTLDIYDKGFNKDSNDIPDVINIQLDPNGTYYAAVASDGLLAKDTVIPLNSEKRQYSFSQPSLSPNDTGNFWLYPSYTQNELLIIQQAVRKGIRKGWNLSAIVREAFNNAGPDEDDMTLVLAKITPQRSEVRGSVLRREFLGILAAGMFGFLENVSAQTPKVKSKTKDLFAVPVDRRYAAFKRSLKNNAALLKAFPAMKSDYETFLSKLKREYPQFFSKGKIPEKAAAFLEEKLPNLAAKILPKIESVLITEDKLPAGAKAAIFPAYGILAISRDHFEAIAKSEDPLKAFLYTLIREGVRLAIPKLQEGNSQVQAMGESAVRFAELAAKIELGDDKDKEKFLTDYLFAFHIQDARFGGYFARVATGYEDMGNEKDRDAKMQALLSLHLQAKSQGRELEFLGIYPAAVGEKKYFNIEYREGDTARQKSIKRVMVPADRAEDKTQWLEATLKESEARYKAIEQAPISDYSRAYDQMSEFMETSSIYSKVNGKAAEIQNNLIKSLKTPRSESRSKKDYSTYLLVRTYHLFALLRDNGVNLFRFELEKIEKARIAIRDRKIDIDIVYGYDVENGEMILLIPEEENIIEFRLNAEDIAALLRTLRAPREKQSAAQTMSLVKRFIQRQLKTAEPIDRNDGFDQLDEALNNLGVRDNYEISSSRNDGIQTIRIKIKGEEGERKERYVAGAGLPTDFVWLMQQLRDLRRDRGRADRVSFNGILTSAIAMILLSFFDKTIRTFLSSPLDILVYIFVGVNVFAIWGIRDQARAANLIQAVRDTVRDYIDQLPIRSELRQKDLAVGLQYNQPLLHLFQIVLRGEGWENFKNKAHLDFQFANILPKTRDISLKARDILFQVRDVLFQARNILFQARDILFQARDILFQAGNILLQHIQFLMDQLHAFTKKLKLALESLQDHFESPFERLVFFFNRFFHKFSPLKNSGEGRTLADQAVRVNINNNKINNLFLAYLLPSLSLLYIRSEQRTSMDVNAPITDPNEIFNFLGPELSETAMRIIWPEILLGSILLGTLPEPLKRVFLITKHFDMFSIHGDLILDSETEQAVIITGTSKVGKSNLTKRLIESGRFILRADDSVIAYFDKKGTLQASYSAYAETAPEARNQGGVPEIYAPTSALQHGFVPVNTIIHLTIDKSLENFQVTSGKLDEHFNDVEGPGFGPLLKDKEGRIRESVLGINVLIPDRKRDYDAIAAAIAQVIPSATKSFAGPRSEQRSLQDTSIYYDPERNPLDELFERFTEERFDKVTAYQEIRDESQKILRGRDNGIFLDKVEPSISEWAGGNASQYLNRLIEILEDALRTSLKELPQYMEKNVVSREEIQWSKDIRETITVEAMSDLVRKVMLEQSKTVRKNQTYPIIGVRFWGSIVKNVLTPKSDIDYAMEIGDKSYAASFVQDFESRFVIAYEDFLREKGMRRRSQYPYLSFFRSIRPGEPIFSDIELPFVRVPFPAPATEPSSGPRSEQRTALNLESRPDPFNPASGNTFWFDDQNRLVEIRDRFEKVRERNEWNKPDPNYLQNIYDQIVTLENLKGHGQLQIFIKKERLADGLEYHMSRVKIGGETIGHFDFRILDADDSSTNDSSLKRVSLDVLNFKDGDYYLQMFYPIGTKNSENYSQWKNKWIAKTVLNWLVTQAALNGKTFHTQDYHGTQNLGLVRLFEELFADEVWLWKKNAWGDLKSNRNIQLPDGQMATLSDGKIPAAELPYRGDARGIIVRGKPKPLSVNFDNENNTVEIYHKNQLIQTVSNASRAEVRENELDPWVGEVAKDFWQQARVERVDDLNAIETNLQSEIRRAIEIESRDIEQANQSIIIRARESGNGIETINSLFVKRDPNQQRGRIDIYMDEVFLVAQSAAMQALARALNLESARHHDGAWHSAFADFSQFDELVAALKNFKSYPEFNGIVLSLENLNPEEMDSQAATLEKMFHQVAVAVQKGQEAPLRGHAALRSVLYDVGSQDSIDEKKVNRDLGGQVQLMPVFHSGIPIQMDANGQWKQEGIMIDPALFQELAKPDKLGFAGAVRFLQLLASPLRRLIQDQIDVKTGLPQINADNIGAILGQVFNAIQASKLSQRAA